MTKRTVFVLVAAAALCRPVIAEVAARAPAHETASSGTRLLEGRNGFSIKMLVEVVWAPGGEASAVSQFLTESPIDR